MDEIGTWKYKLSYDLLEFDFVKILKFLLSSLIDNQRPSVMLSTNSSTRTRHHKILVLIEFLKPVFNFSASAIVISGGHMLGYAFHCTRIPVSLIQKFSK